MSKFERMINKMNKCKTVENLEKISFKFARICAKKSLATSFTVMSACHRIKKNKGWVEE